MHMHINNRCADQMICTVWGDMICGTYQKTLCKSDANQCIPIYYNIYIYIYILFWRVKSNLYKMYMPLCLYEGSLLSQPAVVRSLPPVTWRESHALPFLIPPAMPTALSDAMWTKCRRPSYFMASSATSRFGGQKTLSPVFYIPQWLKISLFYHGSITEDISIIYHWRYLDSTTCEGEAWATTTC